SPQAPGTETRLVITGSTQDLDPEDARTIVLVAKKAGAAGVDIKNLCVKAIQNAARRRNRKGAIGTSVLWAISERNKEVNGGLDVPGGTSAYELPNVLVPGMQMTGIYFEVPRQGKSLIWEKRWPLAESHC